MHEFKLGDREYVELKNLLKLTGVFESGGEAMRAVAGGLVTLDGHVELRKRCKVRAGHIVECAGQRIKVV